MDKDTGPPLSVGGGDVCLAVQAQLSVRQEWKLTWFYSEISPKGFIFVRSSKQADS